VVVPASFSYIDRFRLWSKDFLARIFIADYGKNKKGTHASSTVEQTGAH
jgi:hypothetical protein